MLELLAQLADVALDHVLVDVLVEEAVHRIEDLRLGQAPAAAAQQIFENAPLTARKGEWLAVRLGLTPVEVDAQFAHGRVALLAENGPIDRANSSQNLTHLHGFSHDDITARGPRRERIVERVTLVDAKDGSAGDLTD